MITSITLHHSFFFYNITIKISTFLSIYLKKILFDHIFPLQKRSSLPSLNFSTSFSEYFLFLNYDHQTDKSRPSARNMDRPLFQVLLVLFCLVVTSWAAGLTSWATGLTCTTCSTIANSLSTDFRTEVKSVASKFRLSNAEFLTLAPVLTRHNNPDNYL